MVHYVAAGNRLELIIFRSISYRFSCTVVVFLPKQINAGFRVDYPDVRFGMNPSDPVMIPEDRQM